MKIIGASIAVMAVWYVLRRRRIEAPRRGCPTQPTAPVPPELPGALSETDLRYLAETFEHVNDRIVAQIRSWDGLSAAVLGAVVAVYVLFLDKAEIYWLALVTLVIPALLLYVNTEDRTYNSPDYELFKAVYRTTRIRALEGLIESHQVCIQANSETRHNKRRGFYRSLNWLSGVCLVATLCKGYNAHGEINEKLHQVVTRVEAHSQTTRFNAGLRLRPRGR